MKENEIEYLHKEISCLRNELQFLNTVQCLTCVCVCFGPVSMGSLKLTFLVKYHGMLILIVLNLGNIQQMWSNDFPVSQCFKHVCHSSDLQEKRLACERYAEIHEELSGMKVRSEREIQNLKEHLSLAMAALQEGRKLGNSLDH